MAAFTVQGYRVRTASSRRYVVFVIPREGGDQFDPFIHKRSDSKQTAAQHRDRYNGVARRYGNAVIVDTATGEEV